VSHPRTRTRLVLSLIALFAALVTAFAACSVPPSSASIGVDGPSLQQFSETYAAARSATSTTPATPATSGVGDLLDHSCGSLDCHGNAQRNLVMWGCYGLRLNPSDALGCRSMGGTNTTPEEYLASYQSLVALEPSVMTDVVANHGDPNELTVVRKAFGEEQHTGGQIFGLDTPANACIGSWLAGDMDAGACGTALANAP
jgi:hypothetical protein